MAARQYIKNGEISHHQCHWPDQWQYLLYNSFFRVVFIFTNYTIYKDKKQHQYDLSITYPIWIVASVLSLTLRLHLPPLQISFNYKSTTRSADVFCFETYKKIQDPFFGIPQKCHIHKFLSTEPENIAIMESVKRIFAIRESNFVGFLLHSS